MFQSHTLQVLQFNQIVVLRMQSTEYIGILPISNSPNRYITSIPIVMLCFLLYLIWLVIRHKARPRRLPNVFVAGLDNGRRTLQQAREYFVTNCTEMMFEGYREVGLKMLQSKYYTKTSTRHKADFSTFHHLAARD